MLDTGAVRLVTETKAKLATMTDAKRSEILAVKEKFGRDLLALLAMADQGISQTEKAAAFDKILALQIEHYTTIVTNAVNGDGFFDDEDHIQYTFEEAVRGTLGLNIFRALSALPELLK